MAQAQDRAITSAFSVEKNKHLATLDQFVRFLLSEFPGMTIRVQAVGVDVDPDATQWEHDVTIDALSRDLSTDEVTAITG